MSFAENQSWVSRRLALVRELPTRLQDGMEGAVQQTAELGDLNAIPKKLDDRLAFLDREPNSENTRLAIADARRQALDELNWSCTHEVSAVQGRIEERWGVKLEEARKKMLEPVEPADRLRASTIWAQIPAGLDQTDVDASWPMIRRVQEVTKYKRLFLGPWQKLFPILGWDETQRVVPLRQGRGFFDVE